MATTVDRVAVPGAANTEFTLTPAKDRISVSVFNDTAGDLFVKVGAGASTTSFTAKLVAGALYELPDAYYVDEAITAACSVVAGAVQVTEVTS